MADEGWRVESCVGKVEVVSVAAMIVRAEVIVGSASDMEEGPPVAEEESIVCDEGIGWIEVEEVEEKP